MLVLVLLLLSQPPASCSTVDDCRRQALAAEASGDFETFHDLAWRAVQKGHPNDPELMLLLAHAMSLSGRPGDALVMLSRLAGLGVKTDAETSEDFRRVRALKGWPELEAKIAGVLPAAPVATAAPEATAAPAATPEPAATMEPAGIAFSPAPRVLSGLAYDAVSRRFLLGDRAAARLLVVDEPTHHLATLVGATAAGFYDDLTAFDVDRHRGDLWVVSEKSDGDRSSSVLHKLQLVSGRVLTEIKAEGDVRFVDVGVILDGTVYALDAAGSRIFRLRPGTHALEIAASLHLDAPVSFTVGDDHVGYIASSDRISRIDLASRAVTPVAGGDAASGIEVLRGSGRTLIAIQRTDTGGRLVHLSLDSGGRLVTGVQVLDGASDAVTAASMSGKTVFYVRDGTIRAIHLR